MIENRPQLAVLLIALLLHPQLERWISPFGLAPDLPFMLLFWIAMRAGKLPALLWGMGIGLFRDLADFEQLGASSLALSVSGYFLGIMRDRIDQGSPVMRILLFMVGCLMSQALFFLLAMDWRLPAVLLQWLKQGVPIAILSLALYMAILWAVYLLGKGLRAFREPNATH